MAVFNCYVSSPEGNLQEMLVLVLFKNPQAMGHLPNGCSNQVAPTALVPSWSSSPRRLSWPTKPIMGAGWLEAKKPVKQMDKHDTYPLVIFHIAMERSTIFLMGKLTISMAMFNSKLLVYQRVSLYRWISMGLFLGIWSGCKIPGYAMTFFHQWQIPRLEPVAGLSIKNDDDTSWNMCGSWFATHQLWSYRDFTGIYNH